MKSWALTLFAILSCIACSVSDIIHDVAFEIIFMMDPNSTDATEGPCSESDDEAIEQGIFDGLGILANQTNVTNDEDRNLRHHRELSPSTGFCQAACDGVDEACLYMAYPACDRLLQTPSHTRREKDMDATVESLEEVQEFLDQVVEQIAGLKLIEDLSSLHGQHCQKGKDSIHHALDSADLTDSCSMFVHRNMTIQCYKVANVTSSNGH